MRSHSFVLSGLVLLLGVVGSMAVPSVRQVMLNQLPSTWRIALSAWRHNVEVDHSVVIAMPDGVVLTASLYLPRKASGPLPTVLVRLPYHRLQYSEGFNSGIFFARNGYAVLVQDLRGTGDSQGELLPWRDAAEDGVATLDWITRQPWSTGKVGTFGCSGLGETQFVLSKENHPAHAAMIPSGAGGAVGSAAGRYGYFGVFEGGVLQLATAFGWFTQAGTKSPSAPPAVPFVHADVLRRLPIASLVQSVRAAPNGYDEYLSTPLSDARWETWGYLSDTDHSDVPALVINTWGDQTVGDTLALAESWRLRKGAAPQKVVIAPGKHCNHHVFGTDTDRFGELTIRNAGRPWQELYLRWFGHWLKDQPDAFEDIKAYTYFMLVEDLWHEAEQWPPAEVHFERWFLNSAGKANSRSGDGALSRSNDGSAAFDTYRYDPSNPVPSRGGPVCCTGDPNDLAGPADQRDVEMRDDVLVYTSAPLATDLRFAGPLRARVTVSSDAPDTDFILRLVHVWPDGRATGIQEGALRMRYRDGFQQPKLMEPGQRYEVTVDMRSIAYMIPRGHRLRLQVTSSSFPRLERNLNTGAPNNAAETSLVVATNRVHHSREGSSYLELPVLPAMKASR